jgi:hypothetical protein
MTTGNETRHEIDRVIEGYLADTDGRAQDSLINHGYGEVTAARLQSLWSMDSSCLASVSLQAGLYEAGLDSGLLINRAAHVTEVNSGIVTSIRGKDHILVDVESDEGHFFIDPFWQQFLLDVSVDFDDVLNNRHLNLQPTERVLVYQADDMPDLVGWFAATARAVQDKVARGVMRSRTDIFSRRQPTAVELFLDKDVPGPVDYMPMAQLESIAQRIWSPDYFAPLTEGEFDTALLEESRSASSPATSQSA